MSVSFPMADISWVKRRYLDIAYDNESAAQKLDIYLPKKGEGPFAALIHIHGGGFAMGDKRDAHMETYLKALHYHMAAVSIEYRLSGEAVFPAAVWDVRQAIRFLRENAAQYQLDPDRFVVIGGSAGGNLAAMLAMNVPNGAFPGEQGKNFRIQPFVALGVDQFGPMNFLTMDEQARKNGFSKVEHDEPCSPESRYMGAPLKDAKKEHIQSADPASYVSERMAPMLVQHGTADVLVPPEQSLEFVEKVKEQLPDADITLMWMEGAGHDDSMFGSDENMKLIFDWIHQHLQGMGEL